MLLLEPIDHKSEALFFKVVDIEPYVNGTVLGNNLGNVLFQVLLGLQTHVAQSCIAHRVVPFQHVVRILDFGLICNPRRKFFIDCSRATTPLNNSGVIPVSETIAPPNEQGQ